jgi:hypothetical protein
MPRCLIKLALGNKPQWSETRGDPTSQVRRNRRKGHKNMTKNLATMSLARKSSRIAALALSAALVTSMAAPALASNLITQSLTGGSLSASVANLGLTSVAYSHANQNSSSSMTLTADDSSALGLGWNVTIQSSDFVYSGSYAGSDITASNFSLTSAAAPIQTAGQAIDVTNGPKVPASSPVGSLASARKVIQAGALFGRGTYTQALGVTLVVPGQSLLGTYTGTLTTTIAAGL